VLDLDDRGFILTGRDVAREVSVIAPAQPVHDPLLLETSQPGVFAAGDVRSGSIKRVASAVGEGSIAVQQLHLLFADLERTPRGRSAEQQPTTSG
jgi:thioredoxin reductase (NADPH)